MLLKWLRLARFPIAEARGLAAAQGSDNGTRLKSSAAQEFRQLSGGPRDVRRASLRCQYLTHCRSYKPGKCCRRWADCALPADSDAQGRDFLLCPPEHVDWPDL